MSAPVCPKMLELTRLIEEAQDQPELHNALRYLETFLNNRRGYQRKMQIKRKVLTKYAKEHGFDEEINDAVRAMHQDAMEVESLDDLEEER